LPYLMGGICSCSRRQAAGNSEPLLAENMSKARTVATADHDEDFPAPVKHKMGQKLEFHENRKMCLKNPKTAKDKLLPYATLSVKVVKVTGLLAGADSAGIAETLTSFFKKSDGKTKADPDPFAVLYVNDVEKGKSERKDDNRNPVFNWSPKEPLPISHPQSVLRVEIKDYDAGLMGGHGDLLGWVEVPIADLPYGDKVTGVFDLFPVLVLEGSAPERMEMLCNGSKKANQKQKEQMLAEVAEDVRKIGSVALELTLEHGADGDEDDEWYANCLAAPNFTSYPHHGPPKEHEPLRMQNVYDDGMRLKTGLIDGIVGPCAGCCAYTMHWHEPCFTFLFLGLFVLGCVYTTYMTAILFAIPGIFLLCLASQSRRHAMSYNPSTAPLDDEGFTAICNFDDIDKMEEYLTRVVLAMNGKVVDPDGLREFASFCFADGQPEYAYEDLKGELRDAQKDLEEGQTKFCEFSDKPYAEDTLVEDQDGSIGTVVKCDTPGGKSGEREYTVNFTRGETIGKEKRTGDQLQAYMDFRWMSSTIVRKVIPDGLEDTIMNFGHKFKSNGDAVDKLQHRLHAVFSWESKGKTCAIVMVFFVISLLFAFIGSADMDIPVLDKVYNATGNAVTYVETGLQVFFAGLAVAGCALIAVMGAPCCASLNTRSMANGLTSKHADKSQEKWCFFTPQQTSG